MHTTRYCTAMYTIRYCISIHYKPNGTAVHCKQSDIALHWVILQCMYPKPITAHLLCSIPTLYCTALMLHWHVAAQAKHSAGVTIANCTWRLPILHYLAETADPDHTPLVYSKVNIWITKLRIGGIDFQELCLFITCFWYFFFYERVLNICLSVIWNIIFFHFCNEKLLKYSFMLDVFDQLEIR